MNSAARWRWVRAVGVLALAFSLVIVSAVALNVSLAGMRESFDWVQHTDDVLSRGADIEANLVAAESAGRGYLLTGDDDYRRTFDRLRDALPARFDALRALVADNPPQIARLDQLRPVLDARLDELNQIATEGPAHQDTALGIVRAARARRLAPRIRDQIQDFRRAELELLRQRERTTERDMTWSIAFAATTTILALLSASFALYLFQRADARHRERELRTELIHVSRLNMMGQMASMLAHELNQPLTATGMYLRSMLRIAEAKEAPRSNLMVDALNRSVAQMERARDIVQRLRRFIEKGEPAKSVEEIGAMFDESVTLLGVPREQFTLCRELGPDLPAVLVDRIQVEQVLINLMRNGMEAMERGPRRVLGLSAETDANGAVCIAVSDTGAGLAKEVAARLFQPFVTTKSGGMGVGLSICHTIVVANGGRIWAEPNPEGGTIFRFTLPVAPIVDADRADRWTGREAAPLVTELSAVRNA